MKEKDNLLLKLHEQFSVNQNDTFGRYITLFIALFALFGAYGIAFGLATNLITFGDYKVSPIFFLFLSVFLSIILGFLSCSLIYSGYQHRRDQFLNGKIRRYFFICEKKDNSNSKDQFEHFFNNYQGNKKGLFSFIPDYILINISILGVLKIIILFCMLFVSFQSYSCPIRTADCKTTPSNGVCKDSLNKCSVTINNCNKIFNDNDTLKNNGHQASNVFPVMIFSLVGVLVVYLICILVLFCFYKKYKKLEQEYNKDDLNKLQQLFNEKNDSQIQQI
jgi:hypothetical protein